MMKYIAAISLLFMSVGIAAQPSACTPVEIMLLKSAHPTQVAMDVGAKEKLRCRNHHRVPTGVDIPLLFSWPNICLVF